MEKEIANCLKEGKLIPRKEIFKCFNSVIENINNDKIKKVKNNLFSSGIAAYNFKKQSIIINYYKILIYLFLVSFKPFSSMLNADKNRNICDVVGNKDNYVDNLSILLFQTFFHELSHMTVLSSVDDEEDFSEYYKLLLFSFYLSFVDKKIYAKNHPLFLHEYQADINAYYNLLSFIEKNNIEFKNISIEEINQKIAKKIIYYYTSLNENQIVSPLNNLIKISEMLKINLTNKDLSVINAVNNSSVNSYDSIYCGKNLNDEEFNELKAISNSKVKTKNIFNHFK